METQFKKGDVVYLVGICLYSEKDWSVIVDAKRVTLTSYGKRQGTAVQVKDGKNIQHRIYVGQSLLLRTAVEVEAYAAANALAVGERSIAGSLRCSELNQPHLLPQFRASGLAYIAALKAAKPTYFIKFS